MHSMCHVLPVAHCTMANTCVENNAYSRNIGYAHDIQHPLQKMCHRRHAAFLRSASLRRNVLVSSSQAGSSSLRYNVVLLRAKTSYAPDSKVCVMSASTKTVPAT